LSFRYVATADELARLVDTLDAAAFVGMDTEFERVRTYFPRLCLVQLAIDDAISCIDALALPDLGTLWKALAASPALKVLHAGRQDLELVHRESTRTLGHATMPTPLVDTQIAAGLLGIDEQASYAALVERQLGISLAKAQTRTDWTQRPLTDEQLQYAADDVRYLQPVWASMRQQLQALDREAWVVEDCAPLTLAETYEVDEEAAWKRVKGARRLNGNALAAVQGLAAWRERQAITRDKPRQWVLRDEVLLALAEQRPQNARALRQVRGMPAAFAARHGGDLLAVLTDTATTPHQPVAARRIPDEARVRELLKEIRQIAERESLATSALGTRREIEGLVLGRRDSRLLRGWRREVAGDALLRRLTGDADTSPAS
jgi:ribonuclease D